MWAPVFVCPKSAANLKNSLYYPLLTGLIYKKMCFNYDLEVHLK